MQRSAARASCRAALRYLAREQQPAGCWIDYRLPVGASDQWVTGLVGFACADAARRLGLTASDGIHSVSARAAEWLAGSRTYAEGWGFNGRTGPDADSTAWALRLQRAIGLPVREQDVAFLRAHWIDGAGFATYRRDDAWGDAHADVTPVVMLALTADARRPPRSAAMTAIVRARLADGTWPSYWWRTGHYSTAANVELLCDLEPDLALAEPIAIHPIVTSFDAAGALLTACFAGSPASLRARLAAGLVAAQNDDGGWPGGEHLRVTDPACRRPWIASIGRFYRDGRGLITTAACVRALACHAALGERGCRAPS
jgi:hypothetical protein